MVFLVSGKPQQGIMLLIRCVFQLFIVRYILQVSESYFSVYLGESVRVIVCDVSSCVCFWRVFRYFCGHA